MSNKHEPYPYLNQGNTIILANFVANKTHMILTIAHFHFPYDLRKVT